MIYRLRRRAQLARKLRDEPGLTWRQCWWYAGFVMRLAHEIVQQAPLTDAEVFEVETLSDLGRLKVVA